MNINGKSLVQSCVLLLGLGVSGHLAAQGEANSEDSWNYGAEAYLWGASVGVDTSGGDSIDVEFDDLIKKLKLGAMGYLGAEKGKWRLAADFIYLDVDDNVDEFVLPGIKFDEAELKAWLVAPTVGYEVGRTDSSRFRIYGGARYLWTETTVSVKTSAPLPSEKFSEKEKATLLDGFVGFHGLTDLNDRWYATYLIDVGTGDSDVTYQGLASINYRFDSIDASFGYRYIRWELNDEFIDELDFSGVFAGAKFYF